VPRPPIDLHLVVREIRQHSSPLLPPSDCPLRPFERSANTGVSLLKYIDDHVEPDDVYAAVYDRHPGHLRRVVLAELIEAFERSLKELAAVCIVLFPKNMWHRPRAPGSLTIVLHQADEIIVSEPRPGLPSRPDRPFLPGA
jgi:hypothetical protein